MATANWNHGVEALEPDLHGLINRLTRDHPRCNFFDRRRLACVDGPFAVDGISQRIHDPSKQFTPNGYFQNPPGTARGHTFGKNFIIAEDHNTHGVAFEIHGHAVKAARKLDHLAELRFRQTVNTHDPVGDANDGPFVLRFSMNVQAFDAIPDDVADFGGIQLLHFAFLYLICRPETSSGGLPFGDTRLCSLLYVLCRDSPSFSSLPRTEPSITVSPARMMAPPSRFGSTRLVRVTSFSYLFRNTLARCSDSASVSG